jgi:FRG domain
MKIVVPASSNTVVNPSTREWIPHSFDDFLRELQHLEEQYNTEDRLLVFRGHRKSEWLLDSTFVRSCKVVLFGLKEHHRFSTRLVGSVNLHLALLNLFLFKFGILTTPSAELKEHETSDGIDPWYEYMKRIQQHPDEGWDGPFCLKGTNILDWTKSSDVALYFANDNRAGDGAVYICDATATGKTLQVVSVESILEKMHEEGNAGNALGVPLMFHPQRQIKHQRAKNQQAIYFAQMDLRVDLETIWREQEKVLKNETIVLKLVLPSGTESRVNEYLLRKEITTEFLFPNS